MKGKLMRTVIVTSLLTALMGTALAIYAPQLADKFSGNASAATLQPAVYNGPAQDDTTVAQAPQTARPRYQRARYVEPASPTYTEPVVRRQRSFEKSAMIVAGSAGTGAAIGALAGGGKGAAIGALAGGVGGFIYDRVTAHK